MTVDRRKNNRNIDQGTVHVRESDCSFRRFKNSVYVYVCIKISGEKEIVGLYLCKYRWICACEIFLKILVIIYDDIHFHFVA